MIKSYTQEIVLTFLIHRFGSFVFKKKSFQFFNMHPSLYNFIISNINAEDIEEEEIRRMNSNLQVVGLWS